MRVHGDLDEVAGLTQFGGVERQWHVAAFARGPAFRVDRHRRDFQQSSRHGHPPLRACVAKVADIVANLALHYKHTRVPPATAPTFAGIQRPASTMYSGWPHSGIECAQPHRGREIRTLSPPRYFTAPRITPPTTHFWAKM